MMRKKEYLPPKLEKGSIVCPEIIATSLNGTTEDFSKNPFLESPEEANEGQDTEW